MKSFLIVALLLGSPAFAVSSSSAARSGKAPAARAGRAAARTPAPAAEEKKDEAPAPAATSGGERRKDIITGVTVR